MSSQPLHPESPVILHTRVVTRTGGGPEKTILNSPRFLAPYGYRTLCAYLHPPDEQGFEAVRNLARQCQTPLVEIEDRGAVDLRVVRRLLDLCRSERVTIWHGHDYKTNLLGLLLRPFWPMRLVTTVHGWVEKSWRLSLYYAIDRLCLRRYDAVICVSEDLLETCLAHRVPAQRAVLIENAIDVHEYTRRRSIAEAKVRLGFDPDRLLVGAVGRLSAEKNFAGLVAAVGRLIRDGVAFDLAIAGEGPERERLESLIEQFRLAGHVRLLGHRSDMNDLYEAMDVFVLSSLREGLPNVLLEAMALEVPVVATRIAGIPRVISDGCNGLVVEPGQTEPLAAALGRLVRDAELRARLAIEGRRTIEARFSFAVRMEKVHAVYQRVLGDVSQ